MAAPAEHEGPKVSTARREVRRVLLCASLAGALLVLPAGAATAGPPATGDSLSSLYLYNFLLFVDWPGEVFLDRNALVIGVLDREGGGRLFARIEGKKIRGKTLVIHRVARAAQIDEAWHVLFVHNASPPAIVEVLTRLRGKPCLTVSRIPGFPDLGGMVGFLPPPPPAAPPRTDSTRPAARFRINLDAVLDAGLKIRSRLLRLSEITGDIPNGTPVGK